MLEKIKKIINRWLGFFGYCLTKSIYLAPIDLRTLNNPRAFLYYSKVDRQILINLSLEQGRGLEIFSLSNDSCHPFITSVRGALNSSASKSVLREFLLKYYQLVQPLTASSWLGFKEGEVPHLDSEPPWLTLLPWENTTIEEKRKGQIDCALYDNNEHGSHLSISEGWRNFGPVSDAVLNLEVERLSLLINSIKQKGVKRDDFHGGDIGAIILMNEQDDFRWLVEWGGQHRAAVISAMGYKNVDVRVWQVIERKDFSIWPNVLSGLYSEAAALKIFDKIFSGISLSEVTSAWEAYALSN